MIACGKPHYDVTTVDTQFHTVCNGPNFFQWCYPVVFDNITVEYVSYVKECLMRMVVSPMNFRFWNGMLHDVPNNILGLAC